MKTYIIVAKDYAYNDNYYTPYGFEYLVAMFHDYEKAQEKYWECEKERFVGEALQKYLLGSLQEEETKYQELAEFFQRVWGTDMLDEEGDYRDFILPADISLEHLKEVKNITGLTFHNFCVFDEIPAYYRAIIQSEHIGYEYFLAGYGGIYPENVTTDYEKALNTAIAYVMRLLPDIQQQNNTAPSFCGIWSELSETPLLLEAYLQSCVAFYYDKDKSTIVLNLAYDEAIAHQELKGLYPLLRYKPFLIEKQDLALFLDT